MLLVLPPSETKRSGGEEGSRLDVRALRFPRLNPLRRATLRSIRDLARDPEATIAALSLGPRQTDAVRTNRRVTLSPVLPAVDRYTGVLYDALDATTLDPGSRAWLGEHAVIGTALLGPVGALDPMPDHRLSHDARLPGLALRAEWSAPAGRALDEAASLAGLVLDARSEGYVRLAPLGHPQAGTEVARLRVVSDEGGRRRVLNHVNKAAKGEFTRALATAGCSPRSVDELVMLATGLGFRLERARPEGVGALGTGPASGSASRTAVSPPAGDTVVLDLVVHPPTRR